MTLPSPFFKTDQIQNQPIPIKQTKVSNFYRDPQQQSTQVKPQFLNFCKFCRESFKNTVELSHHRKNHVKCPYDGCKFNANEKTVADHIQRLHLKQSSIVKIQDLTTPEQIEKWREERRKRYPTTQNVILRQKLQEEKFKRGEKLRDPKNRFGDQQQQNFVRNLGKKDHKQHKQNRHNKSNKNGEKISKNQNKFKNIGKESLVEKISKEIIPNKILSTSDDEDEERMTPKFSGTSQLKNYHVDVEEIKEKSALSILEIYGSDSESENNDPVNVSKEKEKDATSIKSESNDFSELNKDKIDDENVSENEKSNDDEAPDEIPTVKQSNEPDEQKTQDEILKSRKRKRQNKNDQPNNNKSPRKSGLDYSRLKKSCNPFLEKLLKRDIVHERNVLLQCVNFVVKNNFFGVGQNAMSKDTCID